jgi:integral membrane sensor domain MASE1
MISSEGVPLSLFALACLIGAELAQFSVSAMTQWPIPLIAPNVGIMTAGLLLLPPRQRPVSLIIATIITAVSMVARHHLPMAPSVGLAAVGALEAVAAALLLGRAFQARIAFRRLEDMWILAAVAAAVPLAGSALAATILRVSSTEPFLRTAMLEWWLAELSGILTIVPIAYGAAAAAPSLLSAVRSWRGLEAIAVIAMTCAVTWAVFGDVVPLPLRLPIYLLPFILWACLRFDVGVAAATVLGASVLGVHFTADGHGPFAMQAAVRDAVLRAQGGVAMAAMFFPMLAGIVAERKRVLIERDVLVSELQRALAEVNRLQGMIPICAWCHKIRDDEGFWQGVDTYLQDRLDATFSHAICPTCSAQQHERYGLSGKTARTTHDV